MEGCREEFSLLDQYWKSIPVSEDMYVRPRVHDAGSADENHLQRTAGQGGGLMNDG